MLKTFRTLFFFALMLGLATGQAAPVTACENGDTSSVCRNCCGMANADCCEKTPPPARSLPSQIVTPSIELKLAVVPVLIGLARWTCLAPSPRAVQMRAFAQRPIQRRLDVTGIRLI